MAVVNEDALDDRISMVSEMCDPELTCQLDCGSNRRKLAKWDWLQKGSLPQGSRLS